MRKVLNIGLNAKDLAINKAFEVGGKVVNRIWKSDEAKNAELTDRYNQLAEVRRKLLYEIQK